MAANSDVAPWLGALPRVSPGVSKSKPWLPSQLLTCKATTLPLERVYREFRVRTARVWVEMKLVDAFGGSFDGAVGEIPLQPVELSAAWATPPKGPKKGRRASRKGREAPAREPSVREKIRHILGEYDQ